MRPIYVLFLLLLVFAQQAYAQLLRFEITGYNVVQDLYDSRYSEAVLPMHLDAQGKRQGPVLICSSGDTKQERPFFRGQWKDDLLIDTAHWYFPGGQLKRRAVFSSTHKMPADNLPWTEFAGAGLRGVLHGEVITWEKTDRGDSIYIGRVETYMQGKRSGTLYNYSRQGQLDYQEEYRDGLRNGSHITYFADGIVNREGIHENDKREGKWNFYYRNGALWQTSLYRKGLEEDSTITYHPNGKMRSVEMYVNGQEMGDHFDFDTLGRLNHYRHYDRYLRRDSVEIYYYSSGNMKDRCQMREDLREGSYSAWHENGKSAEQGQYKNNRRSGLWIYYNDKGVQTRKHDFDKYPEQRILQPDYMTAVGEDERPDVVIITVTELPEIPAFRAYRTLTKADQLRFLRKRDYVDVTARIEKDGKVSYSIVTALPGKNKKQLAGWLAANYEQARPCRFNGGPHQSVVHFRILITK